MAECPASRSPRSWWDCPTARRLHREMIDATREEESMPLFAETDRAKAAQAAYEAHLADGHADEEA